LTDADYSKYSLQELYDIYAKMDNDKFPDKAKEIFEEIKRREKAKGPVISAKSAPLLLRLIAFLIDASIILLIFLLLFILLYRTAFTLDYRKLFRMDMDYIKFLHFTLAGIVSIIYFLINGILLYKFGQTVGKKIAGIKITDLKGEVPPLIKTYVIRFLIPTFIFSIPLFGIILWLLDFSFIFGKSRKCIHDYLAETKVVFSGKEIYF
jgi:uncharacterized RDD family membrane protein YckC